MADARSVMGVDIAVAGEGCWYTVTGMIVVGLATLMAKCARSH